MSWIADAHREWHYVHGDVPCPLDCGAGDDHEFDPDDYPEDNAPIPVPDGPAPF